MQKTKIYRSRGNANFHAYVEHPVYITFIKPMYNNMIKTAIIFNRIN